MRKSCSHWHRRKHHIQRFTGTHGTVVTLAGTGYGHQRAEEASTERLVENPSRLGLSYGKSSVQIKWNADHCGEATVTSGSALLEDAQFPTGFQPEKLWSKLQQGSAVRFGEPVQLVVKVLVLVIVEDAPRNYVSFARGTRSPWRWVPCTGGRRSGQIEVTEHDKVRVSDVDSRPNRASTARTR